MYIITTLTLSLPLSVLFPFWRNLSSTLYILQPTTYTVYCSLPSYWVSEQLQHAALRECAVRLAFSPIGEMFAVAPLNVVNLPKCLALAVSCRIERVKLHRQRGSLKAYCSGAAACTHLLCPRRSPVLVVASCGVIIHAATDCYDGRVEILYSAKLRLCAGRAVILCFVHTDSEKIINGLLRSQPDILFAVSRRILMARWPGDNM